MEPVTTPAKQKRNVNWTEDQSMFLLELIREKKRTIRGKFGSGVTAATKKEALNEICSNVNAKYPAAVRTVEQCEKRWYAMHSKGKAELSAVKRSNNATGGGPPDKKPRLKPEIGVITEILGEDNVSIGGVAGLGNNDITSLLLAKNDQRNAVASTSNPMEPSIELVEEVSKLDTTLVGHIPEESSAMLSLFPPPPIPQHFQDEAPNKYLESAIIAMKEAYEAHKEMCKAQIAHLNLANQYLLKKMKKKTSN